MRVLEVLAGAALLGVVAVVWLTDRPTPSGTPSVEPAPAQTAPAPRGPAVWEEPSLAPKIAPPAAPVALPASLIIRVLDGFDGPLAGAEIRLRGGSTRRTAIVTAGDGEAAFEGLAAGSYGYRIAAPGQPPLLSAAAVRLAAGEMRRVEVRLATREQMLTGRVVDQDGAPVAGLTVKARLWRPPPDPGVLVPESQAEQSGATAADGGFAIDGLTDGEYQVLAIASERYGSASTIARPDGADVRLVVVERRELTVIGAVTNSAGMALADAQVVDLAQPSRRTRSDADGRYELVVEAATGDSEHRLRFAAEGHRSARLAVARGEQDEVLLDAALEPLAEDLAVAAQVSDDSGAPVAGERVYLSSAALGTHYQALADGHGVARFPAVADATDYAVRVLPHGPYQDYARAGLDLGAPVEVALAPLATRVLAGRMVDQAGAPVPHFSLRAQSTQARGKVRQVTSDAAGYFEVQDMPSGPLILEAAAPPHRISGVRLDEGVVQDVDLVLDWGEATVEGRVLGADARPLPGSTVSLSWVQRSGALGSRAERSTTTDGTGGFTFERLGPGRHQLTVSAPGHQPYHRELPADSEWTEIRLEPAA